MSRLTFIPKAQVGESPLSVLQRAAVNNGYHRLLALLHALVPHIDHSNGMLGFVARNSKLYQRICLLIGIQESDIKKSSYDRTGSAREDNLIWQGLHIPYNDVQFKTQKICIPCYVEKGFSLSEWEHKAATGCKDHHVFLEEYCPICHTLWSYDQAPLTCECDIKKITEKLRPIPAEHASLISSYITNNNQTGIDTLSIAYQLVHWWQKIGIPISNEKVASLLFQLVNHQYFDLSTANTVEKLHLNIMLMPLLSRDCKISRSILNTLSSHLLGDIFSKCIEHILINKKEAQDILGISRTRFDKFIDEDLITLKDKSRFSLAEINDLLLSSKWLPINRKNKQLMSAPELQGRQTSLAKLVKVDLLGDQSLSTATCHNNDPFTKNYITIQEASIRLSANTESIRFFIKTGKLPASKGTPKSAVQWAIPIISFDSFFEKHIFASAIARQYGLPVTTTSSRLSSAGIKPISGPNIDGGKTYVFEKAEIESYNLKDILKGTYQSPAGRKIKPSTKIFNQYISSHELAKILNIKTHQVRHVVHDEWISGQKNSQGHYRFNIKEADQLVERINYQFIDIESACQTLGQSFQSFRYTWIHTGFIQEHTLAKTRFVTKEDYAKITALWKVNATSTIIGEELGRHRSFCINLEKVGLIKPTVILGNRIKLYPRKHHLYKCYKIEKRIKYKFTLTQCQ